MTMWAAVRTPNDGEEPFVLPSELAHSFDRAQDAARQTDKETGIEWASANPWRIQSMTVTLLATQ
jgi:hypothetical protein